MGKTRLSGSVSVTANTFTQVEIPFFKGKNHLFLHLFNWCFTCTNGSHILADDTLSIQITARSQSAIIPLGPTCYFREEIMFPAAAAASSPLKLSGLENLQGLMVKSTESLYIGVFSKTEAMVFSYSILVGEQDAV